MFIYNIISAMEETSTIVQIHNDNNINNYRNESSSLIQNPFIYSRDNQYNNIVTPFYQINNLDIIEEAPLIDTLLHSNDRISDIEIMDKEIKKKDDYKDLCNILYCFIGIFIVPFFYLLFYLIIKL